MQSWEDLKTFNLTPCCSAAINETWTALIINPETEIKRSGLGNTEIAKSKYGNYIDVSNKIINLQEDFYPSKILSGVIGKLLILLPVALNTAFATAPAKPIKAISPSPWHPSGLQ